jgi:hypothetical protein
MHEQTGTTEAGERMSLGEEGSYGAMLRPDTGSGEVGRQRQGRVCL